MVCYIAAKVKSFLRIKKNSDIFIPKNIITCVENRFRKG